MFKEFDIKEPVNYWHTINYFSTAPHQIMEMPNYKSPENGNCG